MRKVVRFVVQNIYAFLAGYWIALAGFSLFSDEPGHVLVLYAVIGYLCLIAWSLERRNHRMYRHGMWAAVGILTRMARGSTVDEVKTITKAMLAISDAVRSDDMSGGI